MRVDVPEPPLAPPQPPPSTTRRLLESPILLLVLFHSALRQELADLRRVAAESSDHGRDVALQLRRRFEFLKLVYKYHSAAEDEVIFLALDVHIKNVVSAYRLEHRSTDDLVDSVFHYLDVLAKEDEDTSKPFQELVYFISTLQSTICIHMDKEEEQVFPLLLQQFSAREQASLVWQFMCSVPMTLLEDFLQWMISFLSSDERMDVLHCVKEVVPKEILLQEVVISWLDKEKQTFCGDYGKYRKGALLLNARTDFQQILNLYITEGHNGEKEPSAPTNVGCRPLESVHNWHKAFQRDLIEVLEELYTIRSSNNFSSLIAVIVQLKFFADVLIFYSNALDKIFYPMCIEFAKDCPPTSYQQFLDDCQIEDLQRMLHRKAENVTAIKDFVDKLCRNLEVCIMGIDRYLMSIEAEVFPLIVTNCSNKMQQWLLYTSLEMMPLGLLKCTIIWFSTHLSEDESKSILCSIKQGAPTVNKSLPPLLHEWVRIGYLGKTSVEKFRKELHEIFSNRCCVLSEHKDDFELSCFKLDTHPNSVLNLRPLDTVLVAKGRNSVSTSSSSSSSSNKKYGTLYSSGINFHVFFPQTLKTLSPLSTLSITNNQHCSFLHLETRPVDHIFLFHKALKKDLEYLVSISGMLVENDALLMDFHRRFHLVQFLYQIHSDSEDEIAFPALEAKGKIQNSSCSYSIDHKLEIEHFNKVSVILDQISELCLPSSTGDVDSRCGRKQVYRELCVKLHDMCKSMNRILCDHVNNEEIELWPLFREHLSLEEQEKIIGCMLGRTRAETLQEMIPWLMASLTTDEQNAMMSLWRKATKNTMFDQWLGEWWEGMNRYEIAKVEEESTVPPPWIGDPLEVVLAYMTKDLDNHQVKISDEGREISKGDADCQKMMQCETLDIDGEEDSFNKNQNAHQSSVCSKKSSEVKKKSSKTTDVTNQTDKAVELVHTSQSYRQQEGLLKLSQEELEASIRRIYRDSTLEPRMKSFIIQNLLMSRWIDTQTKSHPDEVLNDEQEIPGRCPSYRDPIKSVFGCQHYKRNCKLVAACCNKLYSCRHCHDEVSDHSMDRKATTLMMCMKCLIIQPISPTCSTVSCNNFSMARYYCRICKLFDDERQIYHCPYCNLCRVGKGLGIDYFHCMNCNACMSRSLSVHICREKCFEDNCPICHEYIFTSSSPIKALPCGHLMHSSCFQDYTCSNYTCPICSKSLGDMQVYFGMLDALLAEEKMPEEYSGKTQVILCNDCEKRGTASFHWLYHKCPHCGSYNTRLL